jgi:ATP-dependent Clp protease adapter protein ClpS
MEQLHVTLPSELIIISRETKVSDRTKMKGNALRKVEKKTTLRAEWTSDDNTTENFFDYVLKKTTKN